MLHMPAYSRAQIASRIQHTLVRPDATRSELVYHLETAAEYRFNAAMIAMCWVPLARDVLRGTGVKIATCFGFGLGNESLHAKIALLRECRALGADEVDYQPNMGFLLSGMYDEFRRESAALVEAAEGMPIKAMLELGYLDSEDEQRHAARLLEEAGVPWVKNSSGTGPHLAPATPENIRLLRETLSPHVKVKASGGIRTLEQVLALFEAGADLVGTSAGVSIVEGTAVALPDNAY
jgi:deoxyribose-phosphate aldolase